MYELKCKMPLHTIYDTHMVRVGKTMHRKWITFVHAMYYSDGKVIPHSSDIKASSTGKLLMVLTLHHGSKGDPADVDFVDFIPASKLKKYMESLNLTLPANLEEIPDDELKKYRKQKKEVDMGDILDEVTKAQVAEG